MLKRNWALIALVYLALAEALSLAPVPDLSLCLMQPEHGQQPTNHDDPKYCPAFHAGAALFFDRTDHFLEAHDKSVLSGFTIVLAISTIGLWLATNKLWAAGEKQFALLAETSAAQSRDMQASIEASNRAATVAALAAEAAHTSNDIARETAERQLRAYVLPVRVTATVMKIGSFPEFKVKIRNAGQTPAYQLMNNVRIFIGPESEADVPLNWNVNMSKTTIAPNMNFFIIGGFGRLRLLTQETVDAVREGRAICCVHGEARYVDAFGNKRTTKYRYYFNKQTGGLSEGRLMAASNGNYAD